MSNKIHTLPSIVWSCAQEVTANQKHHFSDPLASRWGHVSGFSLWNVSRSNVSFPC